jgi:cytochrome c oxidase assembly protein subunit 11
MEPEKPQGRDAQRNRKTAQTLAMLVLGMVMLSFASVPLYDLFCRVTGFGGTPQVADRGSETVTSRKFTVRFNADTSPELPWRFQPLQKEVDVFAGENRLVFYEALNEAKSPVTGMAVYNVTPAEAGIYFNKVQCFCFERQELASGQDMTMPVSFFIDPAIADDPEMKNVDTITLSYTFFPAKE